MEPMEVAKDKLVDLKDALPGLQGLPGVRGGRPVVFAAYNNFGLRIYETADQRHELMPFLSKDDEKPYVVNGVWSIVVHVAVRYLQTGKLREEVEDG